MNTDIFFTLELRINRFLQASFNRAKFAFLLILLIGIRLPAFAQNISASLSYSKASLAINEKFTITVVSLDDEQRNISGFPEIQGFIKKKLKKTSSVEDNSGELTSTFSAIQEYAPLREGRYTLPSFTILVNGQPIKGNSININVGPAINLAPLAKDEQEIESVDKTDEPIIEPEFLPEINGKLSPSLSVAVSSKSVFRGEGITIRLSLLVPENYPDDIQFYDLDVQINEILKKLRPANCWEQDFGLEQVTEYKTKIGKKAFTEYRIYQGTFYPLNAQLIKIPAISLKMLLEKEKGKTPAGLPKIIQSYPYFQSSPIEIQVKELPNHPLRDVVPSGIFKMKEQITKTKVKTGQAIKYFFTIKGNGNPSALTPQEPSPSRSLEIFPPNILLKTSNAGSSTLTTKEFRYQIMPREPGNIPLANQFRFIYFNIKTEKYDTLQSSIVLQSEGKSLGTSNSINTNENGFYEQSSQELNNTIVEGTQLENYRLYLNIGLALLFVCGIGIIFWKV